MIETRGLRKVYRTKKRRQLTVVDAVRGIDLTAAEGENVVWAGPLGLAWSTCLFARSLR
jgi:ABC-2 type transport system ATP-binding protein